MDFPIGLRLKAKAGFRLGLLDKVPSDAGPAGPTASERCAQSRSVCRSMPHVLAASVRERPSSASVSILNSTGEVQS